MRRRAQIVRNASQQCRAVRQQRAAISVAIVLKLRAGSRVRWALSGAGRIVHHRGTFRLCRADEAGARPHHDRKRSAERSRRMVLMMRPTLGGWCVPRSATVNLLVKPPISVPQIEYHLHQMAAVPRRSESFDCNKSVRHAEVCGASSAHEEMIDLVLQFEFEVRPRIRQFDPRLRRKPAARLSCGSLRNRPNHNAFRRGSPYCDSNRADGDYQRRSRQL